MNKQQAENIRVLIRHAETNMTRMLNMNRIKRGCGSPACMLGEAICIVKMPEMMAAYQRAVTGPYSIWGDVCAVFSGAAQSRLFGMQTLNAWGRANVTPQEWAAEARKVLAEHGYTCDDAFSRFLAKVQEPSLTDAERSEAALAGVLDKVR